MGEDMRLSATAILGSTVLALVMSTGVSASSADPVGLVSRLQNTAYGTPPQAARVPKYKRDGVDFKETIETMKESAIEIGFVDGSNLTVGAEARVYIDEFVFDQDNATGHATINLSEGAMRWVTGIMPAGGVQIETPTATISVRGTNVKIGVRANGDSLLGLDEGEVRIVSKGKGDPVTLEEGQGARVTPEGIEVFDQVLAVADPVVDAGWGNLNRRDPSGHGEKGGSDGGNSGGSSGGGTGP
jgi:hypothetical protein